MKIVAWVFVISPLFLSAQLRLQINGALNVAHNKSVHLDEGVSGLYNIPTLGYGLNLNYKSHFFQYQLGFNRAAFGSGSVYKRSGVGFSLPQFQYQFLVFRKIKEVELFRVYEDRKAGVPYTISKPNEKFYFMVFDISPFVGYSLNQAVTKSKYLNGAEIDGYYYYRDVVNTARLDKNIVRNQVYGHSIVFGVKFQFKNKSRDLVALSCLYNLGLNTMITMHYEHLVEDTNLYSKRGSYASKGSYLGFQLSYPISLTKEKYYYPVQKR